MAIYAVDLEELDSLVKFINITILQVKYIVQAKVNVKFLEHNR